MLIALLYYYYFSSETSMLTHYLLECLFCWTLSDFYKIRISAFLLPYVLPILFPSSLLAF